MTAEPSAQDYALVCAGVAKRYGKTPAVRDLSFTLRQGQFFALLGPSGCGKTTSLRLVAGLEVPTRGDIHLGGQKVAGDGAWIPPHRRRVGLVFQDYALFPHMDVARNIAYGLKGSREAKRRRVAEALALVGLSGLDRRMPHQLSGGQQQRVALARALAPAPAIMLLDEPFSNLDAGLRAQVREDVRRILKEAGISTVLVTHDQAEALSLADEVGVMLEGVLRQVAPPETLYREPASAAIARFVGDANFLPGQASGEVVRCSLGMLPLLRPAQGAVQVMLRSEMIGLTPASEGEGNARVVSVAYFGHDYLAQVQLNTPGGQDAALHVRLRAGQALAAGQPVQARVSGPVVAFPTES